MSSRSYRFASLVVAGLAIVACAKRPRVPEPEPTTVYEGPAACAIVPVPRACTAFVGSVSAKDEPTIQKVAGWENERYELDTRTSDIRIRAGSDEGVLRARTTLALLRRGDTVPRRLVSDAPRYAWRGLLVDVARHPLSIDELVAIVDRMALVKLRVLHLHLSDDQGFRLELSSHPELARKGGTRYDDGKRVSGTYSKADIARLVAHAKRRFVEVVPEIDLPGHTLAILASHPELSCKGGPFEVPSAAGVYDDVLCLGNPRTLPLVLEVLEEVASMFPSRYVHVGGDEVPTTRWDGCEKCRAAMRAANLATTGELRGTFVRRVTAHLAKLGKTAIGWDEALDSGAPERMPIMVWGRRETVPKALHAGHDVIAAPHDRVYLDARPTEREDDLLPGGTRKPGASRVLPWDAVMLFDPSEGGTAGTKGQILGGEAALWTENVVSLDEIDALLFPRLLPIAEALWLGGKAHANVDARAAAIADKLETIGVRPFVAPPDLPDRKLFTESVEVAVPSTPLYGGKVELAVDDGPFTAYVAPVVLAKSARVRSVRITPSGQRSAVRESVYTRVVPSPPRGEAAGEKTGLAYRACPGAPTSAKVALTCASPSVGTVGRLEIPPGLPATDFSIAYRAVFVAPATGIYTFEVTSDDGAVLRVDDAVVVDVDGVHDVRARKGEVALAAGTHALDVGFFQAKGGAALSLRVSGPGMTESDGASLFRLP